MTHPVTQADRDAAESAFDDVLGNAGSYAEFGLPSYREAGVRSLAEAFAQHAVRAAERMRSEAEAMALQWRDENKASVAKARKQHCWELADQLDGAAIECNAIATAIRAIPTSSGESNG